MTDRTTLEDALIAEGAKVPDVVNCSCCNRETLAFALVLDDNDTFVCGHCLVDAERVAVIEAEALEKARIEAEEPWASEYGKWVRVERNTLIEAARWGADPVTSPLSEACQAGFRAYIATLNRLTIDYAAPTDVEWPTLPELEYPE